MKTETLRVRNVVDATRFLGAWLRAGEGIGWLAAGTMPNSLYRMPLVYLFLTCVFCYSCSFLFVVFCVFVFFFCSHWSLVDVPLIFFCPADHVTDWQPRVLLGMVEARSVNVKKTTTTTTLAGRRLQKNILDTAVMCVCVCVFSSHSFWTSSSLDVPAGVTQEEGHTGFLIHLLSAVRALIFLARRIQPFLSLVDT